MSVVEKLEELLKNRPKIPSFYHEKTEDETQDKMFNDLCKCYEWFEDFEKTFVAFKKDYVIVPRKQLEEAQREYNELRRFAGQDYPRGKCKHLLELFQEDKK